MRTVGVEEELLLVTAALDRTAPVATRVLEIAGASGTALPGPGAGALVHELQEDQVELYTSPHVSMTALEEELRCWRACAAAAAGEAGARLVASGTAPLVASPQRVRDLRYDRMAERFGIVADQQLTNGCHVHVSVASPEEAVGVLDRIRVWLPTLLALTANSPYWQGADTGYQSFRAQALGRWPVSGPTEVFGSAEAYRSLVDRLVASGVILDHAMVYFDARCSHRHPTVEVRVADVCVDVRDTVLLAALVRALVETAAAQWVEGTPPPDTPAALLRMAGWTASRWGLDGDLLDPVSNVPRPAAEVVDALLAHVAAALVESGDLPLVSEGLARVLSHGNGATRQRAVHARTGSLAEVVAELARVTTDQGD